MVARALMHGIGILFVGQVGMVMPESRRRMPSCTLRRGSRTGQQVALIAFGVLGEALGQDDGAVDGADHFKRGDFARSRASR